MTARPARSLPKKLVRIPAALDEAKLSPLELPVLLLVIVELGYFASKGNLFEWLTGLGNKYEHWQLDEIFSTLILAAIPLLLFSLRRTAQLRESFRRHEEATVEAAKLARHDPLTGLPNRRLLSETMERRLAHHPPKDIYLLMVDLDRFKPVNDGFGHRVGDEVLREIADRLAQLADKQMTVSRIGGDEFAILIAAPASSARATEVAAQVIAEISRPVRVEEHMLEVGASVGIACADQCAGGGGDLLHAADLAMYQAKREGGGCAHRYDTSEIEAHIDRTATIQEMRAGLGRGEFVPYYQPIILLESGALVGFESLARWNHPQRGVLGPDSFIPLAEESGLIGDLAFRLLKHACRDMRRWPAGLTLSINISPVQLKDEMLPERLLKILCASGIAPGRLIVEITESRLIEDYAAARQTIGSLKSAGIQVALDDFGTGFSSLNHLRELRFDRIKIDRAFVMDIDRKENGEIIRALLSLGSGLGVPVTAEGIESPDNASRLAKLGCAFGQGYYFSPPAPAAEALNLIHRMREEAVARDRAKTALSVAAR